MNNEEIYKCEFCGKTSPKLRSLKFHINYCQSNPNRINFDPKTKGKKKAPLSEEQKAKLSEKSKAYHERKSGIFKCVYCGCEFTSQQGATYHQRYCDANPDKKDGHMKGKHHSDETRKKISEHSPHLSNELHPMYGKTVSEVVKQKRYDTMKNNHSFNTSKIEEQLKEYFNTNGIEYIYQYKSDVYPFACDFYFPSKDLYVEIQGSWTHGGRPFNSEDEDCIRQLELWKSKNTKYYKMAIDTWTIRDVKKRKTAKINKLNWIEIFSIDLEECLDVILKLL